MAIEDFTLAFKSTIDKMANDVAIANSLKLVDLSDVTAVKDLLSSSKNAFVWEFLTFDEQPRDPLYAFTFRAGARTTNDAANYDILNLLGSIKKEFSVGNQYGIYDYSGAVVGPKTGFMHITSVMVEPQDYDRQFGIRTATIVGRAVNNG